MKNTPEGNHSNITEAKERMSEVENRVVEITDTEQKKKDKKSLLYYRFLFFSSLPENQTPQCSFFGVCLLVELYL